MDFIPFFLKILPLYFLIGIGFMIGRRTRLQAIDLATVNLNFFAPIVFFDVISRLPFEPRNMALPVICFLMELLLAFVVFFATKQLSKDRKNPYWLAGAGSSINNGYFGIPVFTLIFGAQDLGMYILYAIGATIFFYTVINFLFIRNEYNLKQALHQIIRMPVLHAMVLGIICQLFQVHLPPMFDDFLLTLRHAYIVIGMIIIGLVLGTQSETKTGFVFEWRLILFLNFMRFIVFPALALGCVLLDRHYLHFLSPLAQKIILLVSLMPMAADTISLAVRWKIHPERTAALILINSILALFIIPFLLPILLQL